FTDKLSVPVIFLQGEDDPIVPRKQAEMMVNAIRSKGLPLEYLLFKGEQHGFRIAENIKRALDAELYFYSSLIVKSSQGMCNHAYHPAQRIGGLAPETCVRNLSLPFQRPRRRRIESASGVLASQTLRSSRRD